MKNNNLNTKYFQNEKQKQIAILVRDIVINSGLTQKEFANSIGISLATLTNIYRPNNQKLPTPKVLRLISLKTDNPIVTYKQFMTLLGYDTLKYPFHYVVDKAKTIHTYRIKSHKGNITYTTIVCDYQPKGILVQQLITGGYIIDNIECIDTPCFIIEHRENS